MRVLLPEPGDNVDLVGAYLPAAGSRDGRPFVRANMISAIDGAITVGGRSGALGGAADKKVFHVLRSIADVILVGAGTARAEGYGPVRLDLAEQARRVAQGQAPVPPIAVVTRVAALDWTSPFFTEAAARPLVFTGRISDEDLQRGSAVADIVVSGDARVAPAHVIEQLEMAGFRSVLLEGGPSLNADVVRAGLLDELCLTISPRLVAGDGPRVLAGPELLPPLGLSTVHLLEEDGFLFWRLTVGHLPAH